jgi:malonate-semialdehyde dehydrogenase (acetylating)/methylmalonate-semialdehyde dehydrogenase
VHAIEIQEQAIAAAEKAFPSWSQTPAMKRAQVLFNFRNLLDAHLDELTHMVARENGKCWEEAAGDVLKVKEAVELACGIPSLMMGESTMNASSGFDTILYREAVGVFAGIVPFNFPAMIPMGWMAPLCIAAGNTFVLKAASMTPMTAFACANLWKEAGLPDGVLNIVTCTRNEANKLLSHPTIKGVSFVGSTSVGLQVYTDAAKNGKRVQALCEAKNHALVLRDAALERSALGIINSTFGCAGMRCMALPALCVEEACADEFIGYLLKFAKARKVGCAYDPKTELGPVVSAEHKQSVINWIDKGVEEGAELILDGRDIVVPGFENGHFVGPTIFDHVKPGMSVGDCEIFGPVTTVKRVKDFEEGLAIMNGNRFANGSCIFTQNGHYAREFARRTHGGMVGVNVGIPVPVSYFPFAGHKDSFFGDLHVMGRDGVAFYTEAKCVTSRWFSEEDKQEKTISTWEGTITRK